MALGMGFEGISVRLSAKTKSFRASINRAQETTQSLSRSLSFLQGRADEAADELDDASKSALLSSGAFSALSISTEGASLSFGLLSSSIVGVLGSIATLSTILAPLAGIFGTAAFAAGSLAIALGAVPFLGAAGHTEELRVALSHVSDKLLSITKPLRDQFFAALLAVINDLPRLAERIMAVVGNGDDLASMFLHVWDVVRKVLPGLIGWMIELAKDAFPIVMEGVDWLIENGPSAFEQMREVTERFAPSLLDVADAALQLIDPLLRFGSTVLSLVLPAVEGLIRAATGALRWFNGLRDEFQAVGAAAGLLIGPVVTIVGLFGDAGGIARLLSGRLVGLASAVVGLTGPVGAVALAVAGFIAAVKMGFIDLDRIVSTLKPMIDSAIGSAVTWLKNTGTKLVRQAFNLLGRAIRAVFIEVYNAITGKDDSIIRNMIGSIVSYLKNDAASDMREAAGIAFDALAAAARGMVNGLLGDRGAFSRMVRGIKSSINDVIEGINTAIRKANKLPLIDNIQTVEKLDIKRPGKATPGGRHARAPVVNIGSINASGREEGRAAGQALVEELRSHNLDR